MDLATLTKPDLVALASAVRISVAAATYAEKNALPFSATFDLDDGMVSVVFSIEVAPPGATD